MTLTLCATFLDSKAAFLIIFNEITCSVKQKPQKTNKKKTLKFDPPFR